MTTCGDREVVALLGCGPAAVPRHSALAGGDQSAAAANDASASPPLAALEIAEFALHRLRDDLCGGGSGGGEPSAVIGELLESIECFARFKRTLLLGGAQPPALAAEVRARRAGAERARRSVRHACRSF